jgi:glycosyltransferase involved in cell wall biosynthesis
VTETRKPKLLIVTTTFPRWPDDPGPAPFVFLLARSLLPAFDVTVLAPHAPGAAREEEMEGVRVKRFRYGPDRLEPLTDGAGIRSHLRRGLLPKLAAPMLILAEVLALRRELAAGDYDGVNAHWLVPSGLLAALLCGRKPLAVTAHAADYDLLRALPGGKAFVRFIARRGTIVAVSRRLQDGILAMAPSARVVLQPMGVDTARFGFSEEARRAERERLGLGDDAVILFAGKLSAKKGVAVLLAALATMEPRPRLVIAGAGEERAALETRARELGIAERVTFLGAVANRELAGVYSAADAVAAPSVRDPAGETEGMPVVILEALAAGRPVVATTLCSAPAELVGRGVMEVEPGDASALAQALKAALAGAAPVDLAAVAAFDLARVAERYGRILRGEP